MRTTSILRIQSGECSRRSPTTGLITLGTGNPYNGVVIPGLSKFPQLCTCRRSSPCREYGQ